MLVAQRVPACGRCSEAGTPPEPPLLVRSPPGANGGHRVSASSGSAGTRPGNRRGGESTSMKGQRRSHHFTHSGRCQSPHIPPSPHPHPGCDQDQCPHVPIPTSALPNSASPFPHPHPYIPIPIPTSPSPFLHPHIPLPTSPLQPPRRPLCAVCPGGIGSLVIHLHPGPAACLHSLCAWDIFHLDPGSCTAPAPAVNVNVYG